MPPRRQPRSTRISTNTKLHPWRSLPTPASTSSSPPCRRARRSWPRPSSTPATPPRYGTTRLRALATSWTSTGLDCVCASLAHPPLTRAPPSIHVLAVHGDADSDLLRVLGAHQVVKCPRTHLRLLLLYSPRLEEALDRGQAGRSHAFAMPADALSRGLLTGRHVCCRPWSRECTPTSVIA